VRSVSLCWTIPFATLIRVFRPRKIYRCKDTLPLVLI